LFAHANHALVRHKLRPTFCRAVCATLIAPDRSRAAVAKSLLSGALRYGESEIDPAIHAEILLESARSEARVAILIILLAIGFGLWFNFKGEVVSAISVFAVLTVLPLLVDAKLRRMAAKRLRGTGPQPRGRRPL
jgi:hypothetical protein